VIHRRRIRVRTDLLGEMLLVVQDGLGPGHERLDVCRSREVRGFLAADLSGLPSPNSGESNLLVLAVLPEILVPVPYQL
jgi:hypothetical protein